MKPKFEAANAGLTINLVDGGDNAGPDRHRQPRACRAADQDRSAGRLLRGLRLRACPQGGLDAGPVGGFLQGGARRTTPRSTRSPRTSRPTSSTAARRCCSPTTPTKLPKDKAPKTWADLVAWIKANPGQFIYNRPDKGGSGGNFVVRAIYEANGKDPKLFKVDNYEPGQGRAMLAKAWAILNDLAPSLMDKGAYTSGNTQSIQLLEPGRRDHDPGLVGPVAVGDQAGRAARHHRPRAALRSRFPRRLHQQHASRPTAPTRPRRSSSPTSC